MCNVPSKNKCQQDPCLRNYKCQQHAGDELLSDLRAKGRVVTIYQFFFTLAQMVGNGRPTAKVTMELQNDPYGDGTQQPTQRVLIKGECSKNCKHRHFTACDIVRQLHNLPPHVREAPLDPRQAAPCLYGLCGICDPARCTRPCRFGGFVQRN